MKVKCIDNSGGNNLSKYLTIGKEYDVIGNPCIAEYRIVDDSGLEFPYLKRRFEVVNESAQAPKRVICIDKDFATNNYITLNKPYEVVVETAHTYEILFRHNWTSVYDKKYFEEVKEIPISPLSYDDCIGCPQIKIKSISLVGGPVIDKEEERLRKALSPSRLPHECACGITRSQCVYHK